MRHARAPLPFEGINWIEEIRARTARASDEELQRLVDSILVAPTTRQLALQELESRSDLRRARR